MRISDQITVHNIHTRKDLHSLKTIMTHKETFIDTIGGGRTGSKLGRLQNKM
jgi:hypothetical protein